MSSSATEPPKVVPAQLASLSIYNPSLGTTDETVRDQILYFYCRTQRDRRGNETCDAAGDQEGSEEEENQRLRQVGLAQGIVDFANNFSNGTSVNSIETEKSRVILHQLEPGWWILASVDVTRLPQQPSSSTGKPPGPRFEYSAREVAPPQLLLKHILRAHAIFLLHHAESLSVLYDRVGRIQFCNLLEKYWTRFSREWDVLLHGNPVVDIYNGVKLAAGGELGVGVGEEDWGSGERDVLEDFVKRTEGLVDLVVSRFGDAPAQLGSEPAKATARSVLQQPTPWLGTELDPQSWDGVVFSGVGAISRRSLATVSQWMESIFKQDEEAYGVGENPSSQHRRKKRKLFSRARQSKNAPEPKIEEPHPVVKSSGGRAPDLRREAMERNATPPGIPPPLVSAVEPSLDEAVSKARPKEPNKLSGVETPKTDEDQDSSLFGTEKMMKYLSLGYGSSWTLSPKGLPANKEDGPEPNPTYQRSSSQKNIPGENDSEQPKNAGGTDFPSLQRVDPTPEVSDDDDTSFVQRLEQSIGKFTIGLSGDLENLEFSEDDKNEQDGTDRVETHRLFIRTLTLGMSTSPAAKARQPSHTDSKLPATGSLKNMMEPPTSASASIDGAQPIFNYQKMQVAVYVHQPFMFVFLFKLHTPSLTIPSFYRSIHHQLGPLQKPLLDSTDPSKVALRIAEAMSESSSTTTPIKENTAGQTIYDIVYDPVKLTVRTSIPNIPPPGSLAAEGLGSTSSSLTISGSWYTLGIPISSTSSPSRRAPSNPVQNEWTRIEALNVHTQMLNSWIATRDSTEVERTVKTGRGWWILWMLIHNNDSTPAKEAFLVRKATDHKVVAGGAGKWLLREQTRVINGSSADGTGWDQATSSASVGEGVGVDARKWIDGLLHLSR